MTFQSDRLPTLQKLGVTLPDDVNAVQVASKWLQDFSEVISTRRITTLSNLFLENALWRDLLALTWDFRCFDGLEKIRHFLTDRLEEADFKKLQLRNFVNFQKPFPDLAWIIGMFDFETRVGIGSGVFRLVPTLDGTWKAYTVFTNLEDLTGHPERIGSRRSHSITPGYQWLENRRRETEFESSAPAVLIIGGGHCGLELAARLKALDVTSLVVESEARVGDKWRKRYDALCLHWPVWYDHMPYIPFPPSWPVYSPAPKIADWIESYAKTLELNVWTSSTVTQARQIEGGKWSVNIRRGDSQRQLVVNHLVFATGLGDKHPRVPNIPEREEFEGETLHSSQYKRAQDYLGKKVVVIGAGNSGHDVAADLANHNVDVTMFQRSSTFVMNIDRHWKFLGGALYSEASPPTDIADRLFASMPHALQAGGMSQRATKAIEADYKDTLDGLRKAGFKLNSGINGTGILLLLKQKGGGHYFDIGASQLIIDGKIKIKSDAQISAFTKSGLAFDDVSTLDADVVIFATGLGDLKQPIKKICGDVVAEQTNPLWGINDEGEFNGWYRELGLPGLWFIAGPLQLARFHSKHVALQIKAKEENLFGTRYTLSK
ncbi:hypothetical protein AX16_003840 [Volvariella volvacea WC 439]|nr:hypothetical protein AX16_003840 [Volvariella volvacea WC 439]